MAQDKNQGMTVVVYHLEENTSLVTLQGSLRSGGGGVREENAIHGS